jgi:superfamily II DNA or RNA helicase
MLLNVFQGTRLLNSGVRDLASRLVRLKNVQERCLATVADYLKLPVPSPEQELVLKALRQGRNARVNAVAGSGKTTTILQIAQAFPNRKILGIVFQQPAS